MPLVHVRRARNHPGKTAWIVTDDHYQPGLWTRRFSSWRRAMNYADALGWAIEADNSV